MEKKIFARDIASALNIHLGTVYQAMKKNPHGSPKTVETIRAYAESVGYDSHKAMGGIREKKPYPHIVGCYGWRAIYIKTSPFNTYEEYVEHCSKLRKSGWTNTEIAKFCGCTPQMVRNAIGRQPAEYTAYSMAKVGEDRVRKNMARKERVEALRKAEAERKRAEISTKIAEAERHAEELNAKWNEALQTVSKCNQARVEQMRMIAELQKKLEEVA